MFLGSLVNSDQGKRKLCLFVDYWISYVVELRCDWKLNWMKPYEHALGFGNVGHWVLGLIDSWN